MEMGPPTDRRERGHDGFPSLPSVFDSDGTRPGDRSFVVATSLLAVSNTVAVDAVAKPTSNVDSIPDRTIGSDENITSELSPTQATVDTMDSTSSPSIKVIYEMTKSNGDIGFLVVGSGVRFVEYGLTINPKNTGMKSIRSKI